MIEETSPAARRAAERAPIFYGRYELLSELGRGTSGVVYKAHDPKLDRLVALKILRPELVSLDESGVSLKQRFHQEAVAAGRLTHPAIIAVHDVGEAESRPFIIMEYIDGGTLADLLLGGQPLPLADAVEIVVQVCAALDYAHRHGVVHRDVKPRNILVGPGVTKVTDFGTARILDASHTQTGTMLGTPAYMSPEMVRGQAADPRSDLFSLGVVLYETLTGVNPFNAADLAAVLYRIVNLDAPSVRHHNAELPPALDRVLRRALTKEPEARYATATDFANALREAATGEKRTWTLRTFREAVQDLRRTRLLSRPVRVAVGVTCLLALVAGTWAGLRESDLPRTSAPGSVVKREIEPAARPATPTVMAPAARPTPPPVSTPAARPAPPAVTASPARPAPLAETSPPARPVTPPVATPAARPATPTVVTPAARPAISTAAAPPALSSVAVTPQEPRCLSVNALPFAEVFIDDKSAGYTPMACLRVPVGEHRVRFQMDTQRSPERLLRITARHTPDAPMRLSYDFNTGRFIEQ
jgi:eukaryotic-like serine/threonine-protein kinase